MPNRLAQETSPYLLQHAENPVDWMPWGEEALQRAKDEQRPIFLSIGYSACHWCHVMEHESFQDPQIAAELNERFVCIKVDREERPDLDQIYMNAVQLMTGRGGWPMSVFLTPALEPFYGGTYWPPKRKMGMPGFDEVIKGVDEAWRNWREQAIQQAGELTRRIQSISDTGIEPPALEVRLLDSALAALERDFDFTHGGFGKAPKFPRPMDLQLLLRIWRRSGSQRALQMVRLNLDKMARGGIFDHLAGGFARYSVDERWLAPHFEKMLYDNALLSEVYVEAFLATGDSSYAATAQQTLNYVLREMTHELGGFYSTEDADSEGVEGKFYLWSSAEIVQVLGEERGTRFCQIYDVSDTGNFEGQNIIHLPHPIAKIAEQNGWNQAQLELELQQDREQLRQHREARVHPGKDDKILASWNGLMIQAMSRAAIAFDDEQYRQAARRAGEFICEQMQLPDGRLLHSWRDGEAKFEAYLEDYAYLANAFITLYEATFEERWIETACGFADQMLAKFQDEQQGGFFFTASDHEALIARNKDLHDSSVPSSTAMAATALFRLGRLTGRTRYLDGAESGLQSAGDLLTRSPAAAGQFLIALDMHLGPFREIVIVNGDDNQALTLSRAIGQQYQPNQVVACRTDLEQPGSDALAEAFEGRLEKQAETMVYVCQQYACQTPLNAEQARQALVDQTLVD